MLYIDYPVNKYEVYLDFENNREEMEKIDSLLAPARTYGAAIFTRIRIRGYASPEGNSENNERLAANRSRQFMYYIRETYHLPEKLFEVSWVAEDWEGTERLLNELRPPYRQAALDIIGRYSIFQGREKHLMELQGGDPYRDMLKTIFPRLRRIEVMVEYDGSRIPAKEKTNSKK